MNVSRPTAPGRAAGWALVFVVATLGVQWLPGAADSWQFERGAYRAGAWWQLLTAQWVHWGAVHAAANAAGWVVLLLAFHRLVAGRIQALALLGGYAGVAMVLALDANCARYAGASGALHGLLAGSALALWLPGLHFDGPRAQRTGGLMLLGLAIKLLVQHGDGNPMAPGWLGFATYYPAHTAGAAGGLVAVLLAYTLRRHRRAGPDSGS